MQAIFVNSSLLLWVCSVIVGTLGVAYGDPSPTHTFADSAQVCTGTGPGGRGSVCSAWMVPLRHKKESN